MIRVRLAILGVLALTLSGCAYQGVATLRGGGAELAGGGPKVKGRYAALVQSGGWQLRTERNSPTCPGATYDVDLNAAWDKTAKEALSAALEEVDFVTSVVKPEDLKRQGYVGEIIITPTNAVNRLEVRNKFLSAEAVSDTRLDSILAINWADGTAYQEPVIGRALASSNVVGCEQPMEVVSDSAGRSVRDAIRRLTASVKRVASERKS